MNKEHQRLGVSRYSLVYSLHALGSGSGRECGDSVAWGCAAEEASALMPSALMSVAMMTVALVAAATLRRR